MLGARLVPLGDQTNTLARQHGANTSHGQGGKPVPSCKSCQASASRVMDPCIGHPCLDNSTSTVAGGVTYAPGPGSWTHELPNPYPKRTRVECAEPAGLPTTCQGVPIAVHRPQQQQAPVACRIAVRHGTGATRAGVQCASAAPLTEPASLERTSQEARWQQPQPQRQLQHQHLGQRNGLPGGMTVGSAGSLAGHACGPPAVPPPPGPCQGVPNPQRGQWTPAASDFQRQHPVLQQLGQCHLPPPHQQQQQQRQQQQLMTYNGGTRPPASNGCQQGHELSYGHQPWQHEPPPQRQGTPACPERHQGPQKQQGHTASRQPVGLQQQQQQQQQQSQRPHWQPPPGASVQVRDSHAVPIVPTAPCAGPTPTPALPPPSILQRHPAQAPAAHPPLVQHRAWSQQTATQPATTVPSGNAPHPAVHQAAAAAACGNAAAMPLPPPAAGAASGPTMLSAPRPSIAQPCGTANAACADTQRHTRVGAAPHHGVWHGAPAAPPQPAHAQLHAPHAAVWRAPGAPQATAWQQGPAPQQHPYHHQQQQQQQLPPYQPEQCLQQHPFQVPRQSAWQEPHREALVNGPQPLQQHMHPAQACGRPAWGPGPTHTPSGAASTGHNTNAPVSTHWRAGVQPSVCDGPAAASSAMRVPCPNGVPAATTKVDLHSAASLQACLEQAPPHGLASGAVGDRLSLAAASLEPMDGVPPLEGCKAQAGAVAHAHVPAACAAHLCAPLAELNGGPAGAWQRIGQEAVEETVARSALMAESFGGSAGRPAGGRATMEDEPSHDGGEDRAMHSINAGIKASGSAAVPAGANGGGSGAGAAGVEPGGAADACHARAAAAPGDGAPLSGGGEASGSGSGRRLPASLRGGGGGGSCAVSNTAGSARGALGAAGAPAAGAVPASALSTAPGGRRDGKRPALPSLAEALAAKAAAEAGGAAAAAAVAPAAPPPRYPTLTYSGTTRYSCNAAEVDWLCGQLLEARPPVVGLDVEWRPQYTAGAAGNPVALVQLCYPTRSGGLQDVDRDAGRHCCCLLLHVVHSGVTPRLRELLEAASPGKVGVNISGDARKLKADHGVDVNGVVELEAAANERVLMRIENVTVDTEYRSRWSLAALVHSTLRRHLPKPNSTRCGNWEKRPLDAAQRTYAALDAYAGLAVWAALARLPYRPKGHAAAAVPAAAVPVAGLAPAAAAPASSAAAGVVLLQATAGSVGGTAAASGASGATAPAAVAAASVTVEGSTAGPTAPATAAATATVTAGANATAVAATVSVTTTTCVSAAAAPRSSAAAALALPPPLPAATMRSSPPAAPWVAAKALVAAGPAHEVPPGAAPRQVVTLAVCAGVVGTAASAADSMGTLRSPACAETAVASAATGGPSVACSAATVKSATAATAANGHALTLPPPPLAATRALVARAAASAAPGPGVGPSVARDAATGQRV